MSGTGKEMEPSDVIELSIPVRTDLVVLARLTAATLATRVGFDVEEIEDLRLAVEELCLSLVRSGDDGRLRLCYTREGDDRIAIECSFEPAPGSQGHGPPVDDLSLRILDALVDEHGRSQEDGHNRAWLRKRRSRTAV
ncbi:MAG: ATP-binding protein [Acidimicrobiales bacterium]